MKTEITILQSVESDQFTQKQLLESNSLYLVRHIRVVGLGHEAIETLVFIDSKKDAHSLTHPECNWSGEYALQIVRKLDKVVINY